MEYKKYIDKRVVVFPQPYTFGSFIRTEHAIEACEIAIKEIELDKSIVGRSVFIVLYESLMICRCFDERIKAEKFVSGSGKFVIKEIAIS